MKHMGSSYQKPNNLVVLITLPRLATIPLSNASADGANHHDKECRSGFSWEGRSENFILKSSLV